MLIRSYHTSSWHFLLTVLQSFAIIFQFWQFVFLSLSFLSRLVLFLYASLHTKVVHAPSPCTSHRYNHWTTDVNICNTFNINVVFYDSSCYKTLDVLILNYHFFVYRETSFNCCLSTVHVIAQVTSSLPAMPFYGMWTFFRWWKRIDSIIGNIKTLQITAMYGSHEVCEVWENIITGVSSNHYGTKTHVHLFMTDLI